MKIRAFVLDDSEAVRSIVTSVLEERGYEVFAFDKPGVCPLFLKQDCPCPLDEVCGDLVITDIEMPGMTGLDFIENQIRHNCKIKILVVMSGGWTDEYLERAKKLGCHIIEKPFRPAQLEDWLNEFESKLDLNRKLSDWFKHQAG